MATRHDAPVDQIGPDEIFPVQESARPPKRSKDHREIGSPSHSAAEPGSIRPLARESNDAATLSKQRESAELVPGTASVAAEASDLQATNAALSELEIERHGRTIGHVDSLDFRLIDGWVWHPDKPDEPVDVEFLADEVAILRVTADRFRDDLLLVPAGNGRHGFLVQDLESYLPPDTHSITVRRASDRVEIPGSPILIRQADRTGSAHKGSLIVSASEQDIQRTRRTSDLTEKVEQQGKRVAGPLDLLPIGNIDRIDLDEITGWTWDPDRPDVPIDIEILDDDVVVLKVPADQFRSDLIDICAGNGYHGFSVKNLVGIFPLSRHRVRVRRAIDGLDLPESPAWITQPGLDFRAVDFIEQVMLTASHAAAKAQDLDQPLGHLLRLLGELVNAREELALAQKSPPQNAVTELVDGMLTGRTRELVETIRFTYNMLRFEPSENPLVSVIIPVHNKFAVTYDCLKSIRDALPQRSFEIIIIDDCSDDETLLGVLVVSGAARILRNPSNIGFVRSCNAGAAAARGKFLLFLNNDTLVKPGWLDELVQTFEQVSNIGIAGSRLLFADGKLQEAGGIIWRLGDGWNWGRGRDPDEPAFSYLRDADWVSGAALMIPAELFRELGGFDEIFAPAYYEDTDLAFRVRASGRRVVVQPASEIIHLEGVSNGTDTAGPGVKRFQVVNHAKFFQRWKDTLVTHRFNGQHPEQEAERLVRRRAYFIDDSVPTPDQDAGSNAAVEHMRTLMELGYKVTFLPADNMARIDPYTLQLQKIGIECLHHPYYWSVEEVFRKAAQKPDLVYLHRHTNASKYATMVRRYFPGCRIVYSVADLHFLRMERQAAVETGTISAAQVLQQRRDEMSSMQTVDCVIVHSAAEARLLHEADPSLFLEVVPWTVRIKPTPLPFAKRSGLAFVGGFGHPPNLDAVRYYRDDILPLLRRPLPDAITYLVGSKMPDELATIRVPNIAPVGFVSVLADVLNRLRLTVVPLRYGAGIKGKVLESFAHGLPCVMSEVAAEGLELPNDLSWLVARTPGDFVEKITRVHEEEAFNRKLVEAGLAFIERRHSAGVVREALRAAVGG